MQQTHRSSHIIAAITLSAAAMDVPQSPGFVQGAWPALFVNPDTLVTLAARSGRLAFLASAKRAWGVAEYQTLHLSAIGTCAGHNGFDKLSFA